MHRDSLFICACPSTRDGEPCVRDMPHALDAQHRGASGRRWYYSDDEQRGMPKRYIMDHIPFVELVYEDLRKKG